MDINDILNSLGIDLKNPEAKRGAIEAIQAIIDSRTPTPDMSGIDMSGTGAPTEKEIDVEIDPDLLQPSQKFNQPSSNDDVEIEDEENILSQVKHNKPEDPIDNDGNSSGDDTSGSDSNSNSSDEDSFESSSEEASSSDSSTDAGSESDSSEESDGSDTANDGDADGLDTDSTDDSGNAEGTDEDEYALDDEESTSNSDELKNSDNDFEDEDTSNNDKESEEVKSEDDEDSDVDENDEFDFDEDDFLDDELKNSYDDQEVQTKREARRIKRERTLAAARTALDKARAKNVAPALIRELEKAIEALESLTEAKAKSIADISDEEFNLLVNRVFDAISAVGDNELTFTSDEDRKLKAQEIKTDLGSRETQQALSDEDIAAIRAETQAVKAREKETAVYRKPAASSFKGFQDFLNSLYRAIALQVQTNEVQDDTWSAINRRYSGTGVLKQGQRKNELPDRKIPVIDFYFDCSGSWGPKDIEVGKKAVSTLVDMEEKGQIKINIYYFSNHVFNDMQSASSEGGTQAWNYIVKNVIATQATNVIIMTDSDMEDWWEGSGRGEPALKYTVPGYVWYLWRDGSNAPRLPRDLKGRGGVQQFSFSRGDV